MKVWIVCGTFMKEDPYTFTIHKCFDSKGKAQAYYDIENPNSVDYLEIIEIKVE